MSVLGVNKLATPVLVHRAINEVVLMAHRCCLNCLSQTYEVIFRNSWALEICSASLNESDSNRDDVYSLE